MRFNVSQKDFLQGIQTVQRAVSNKNSLPILSGILIKTEDCRLKLVATDLEVGIECYVDAEVLQSGEIVLPANHLSSIIRELPSRLVEVNCNLNKKAAEIICEKSRYNINGFLAEDFPLLPSVEDSTKITLNQGMLKNMLDQVKIATSYDETQPFLMGALLKITSDQIIMASTNTFRLALKELKIKTGLSVKEIIEVILPNKALDELARLLDEEKQEVSIQIAENQVLFEINDMTIITRIIEGKFPNYKAVIPKDARTFVTVNRKEFLQAAKRVSLFAISNSNIVKATIKDKILTLDSSMLDSGQAYEELEISADGPEVEISFNATYMMDALKVIDTETVDLHFGSKLEPFKLHPFKDRSYTYVVSPIRS